MGVPKFYRFIVDRYPCITRTVKVHEIPTYDNLYLDMTAIIHNCSHPMDSDVHFRVTKKQFSDKDIFANVTRYVELIFRVVKPLEVMFLAFDGVAPRAKMNQQRATRFRAAKKLAMSVLEEELDEDELFDSNCITPGTVFMAELIEYVRHFVAYKISTDPMWQNCKIVLSGPEVPGEGEHKIMQFIRNKRNEVGGKQLIRHCAYSADADMVILGLACHEPYFSIIKEKIPFGKKLILQTPEESDFELLHLSLLKEYLEHEFAPLLNNESGLKCEFNINSIINDWILISFLVGNDFIPNLPNLNIVNGALQKLYEYYIKVFPDIGYINLNGVLNLDNLEKFLNSLSDIESDVTVVGDFEKENYYKTKFKDENVDKLFVKTMVDDYVKGLQWTLTYYYQGCSSWGWYYPYHYAPAISDIRDIQNVSMNFKLNEPFRPLEHLLAVLPRVNYHLLPSAYKTLLTKENSPIIDLYPEDFEVDLNGKTNDWEAVVLIPFIDEKRLLNAMEPYNKKLSLRESNLNKIGKTCIFTYSKVGMGQYPVDTIYENFINHAQLQYIKFEDSLKQKVVSNNFKTDIKFPGFPTFDLINYRFSILKRKRSSKDLAQEVETIYLNVLPKPTPSLEEASKELLGKTVFVNWPYIQEAYVIGVTDFNEKIFLKNFWTGYDMSNLTSTVISDDNMLKILKDENSWIREKYKDDLCININETKIFIYVFLSLGKRYTCNRFGKMHLQTKWNNISEVFPYQLVVNNVEQEKQCLLYKSITDMFCASTLCFVINHPHYGAMGTIVKLFEEQQKVVVSLNLKSDPDFTSSAENYFCNNSNFINSNLVAQKLKISSTIINRITGSLRVEKNSDEFKTYYNLGLRIKSPKYNKELYEYTKKNNESWLYSSKAVELIENYITAFPDLFKNLHKNELKTTFNVSDLFPENPDQIENVKKWLSKQTANYPTFVDCGTKNLGREGVSKIEAFISDFYSKKQEDKTIKKAVSCAFLFRPGTSTGLIPPDPKARFKLLDRVICVKNNFTVPLGLKGTVIGILEREDVHKNTYEILFDTSFTGGLTLYNSSEHRCYRLTASDLINLSHGKREEEKLKTNTAKSHEVKRDIKNGTTSNEKRNYSSKVQSNSDSNLKKSQSNMNKKMPSNQQSKTAGSLNQARSDKDKPQSTSDKNTHSNATNKRTQLNSDRKTHLNPDRTQSNTDRETYSNPDRTQSNPDRRTQSKPSGFVNRRAYGDVDKKTAPNKNWRSSETKIHQDAKTKTTNLNKNESRLNINLNNLNISEPTRKEKK